VLPLWCELVPAEHVARAEGVLAVIGFGHPAGADEWPLPQQPLATIALQQLTEPLAEVWRTEDPVTRDTLGPIRFAATSRVVLGTLALDAADAERAGAAAFDAIIEFARTSGYPHLLRIWNHVGGINDVENGGERYRSFCVGRHDSFARHGYALRTDLPAASAVGISGRGYQAYFVAAKEPGIQIENPWQVSAYDYPPQYGRRSPSFSRATVLPGDGQSLVFVAGTASIVGHETKHPGDVCKQTGETIQNISRVLEAAGASLGDLSMAKAYVRRTDDYPAVRQHLRAALGETPVLYVLANVCRADLLVEVEGVARVS
jgi:chorismate lyase/3-hydroxybenzoate synthase